MTIEELFTIINSRKLINADASYVAMLLNNPDRLIQKIGEEATEVVIAAKNQNKTRQIEELTDLLFHSVVLWKALSITPQDVYNELEKRKK